MPDIEKKVQVFYNADHNPTIWYSPSDGNVEMKQSGKITFEKGNDNNDFSFSGITITPSSSDFSIDSLNNNKLTIVDSDADPGTYEYTLSLDTSTGSVRSDPQIINKEE